MSQIHQCNDGTEDITGRGTPNKIPCVNQGGVVGSALNWKEVTQNFALTFPYLPPPPQPPTMQPPPPRQRMASGDNKGKANQLLIFLAIGVLVVSAGMWYYKTRIEPR